jgi:drug/metabolite transporter (DMT)-like permease
MSVTRNQRADLFMLFITLIWSGTFLYTALRFALASLIGYGLWFRYMRGISSKDILHGSILGFFFGLGFLSQTWGLQHTTVANSSFITGSMAIFTPIAAYFISNKSVSTIQMIGIFTVLTGLAFFSQHGTSEWRFNSGDLATLFCAIMWGMYITYTDIFMSKAEDVPTISARLTLVQFIVSCILAFLCAVMFEGSPTHMSSLIMTAFSSADFLIALLYTSILASIVATYVQTRYQHETTPVKAALMFSTEPVAATAFAVIVGMETVSLEKFVLGGIVILGVLIAQSEDFIPILRKYTQDS